MTSARSDNRVTICEVDPRDGLQNESLPLDPIERAELSDRLAATGLPRIEAESFVHPELVPQMADADTAARNGEPSRHLCPVAS